MLQCVFLISRLDLRSPRVFSPSSPARTSFTAGSTNADPPVKIVVTETLGLKGHCQPGRDYLDRRFILPLHILSALGLEAPLPQDCAVQSGLFFSKQDE